MQPQLVVVHQASPPKDTGVAYLLWFFLGGLGAHRFYLGQTAIGIIYLFTFGLCGFGLLADLFLLAGEVRRHNERAQQQVLAAQQHAMQQMQAAAHYQQQMAAQQYQQHQQPWHR